MYWLTRFSILLIFLACGRTETSKVSVYHEIQYTDQDLVLNGRQYQILERLGWGSEGVVYSVIEQGGDVNQIEYVVKIPMVSKVREETDFYRERLKRLLREVDIKLAETLDSLGIQKSFVQFSDNGMILFKNYVPGPLLKTVLYERQYLSDRKFGIELMDLISRLVNQQTLIKDLHEENLIFNTRTQTWEIIDGELDSAGSVKKAEVLKYYLDQFHSTLFLFPNDQIKDMLTYLQRHTEIYHVDFKIILEALCG